MMLRVTEKRRNTVKWFIVQTNTYYYNDLNWLERIVMVGQTNKLFIMVTTTTATRQAARMPEQ